jgi:hypothetical protein
MNAEAVLKKLDHIEDIPTLPTIVFELNEGLQDLERYGQLPGGRLRHLRAPFCAEIFSDSYI